MNKLLMMAGAALLATGGVALAQAAPGAMMPGQTAPDAAAAPAMPDAQAQAAQTPDAAMAPAAAAPSAPRHYPACSRTRHDECRNPGGK
ncbi:MAG: hypothetical protein KGN34_12010 [Sphingomonadales bacterium]|nr:hypothetical protein [Sphingomonadales bacterium]